MKPTEVWIEQSKGGRMIRIDAYFLYQVGAAIRPLTGITTDWTKNEVLSVLWAAENWLDTLLNNSVYKLQTCVLSGNALLTTVKRLREEYTNDKANREGKIGWLDRFYIQSESQTFETVLAAELQWGQLYLVEPKGGYDLNQLTGNGIVIFPKALPEKVPEAIPDAQEAARCIAFALPTAAAFHLHRINELVLRRYYDTVTNGAARPLSRNIGAYIDAMKNAHFKDQKVFGALATLKDFHRNPVLHPDDRLDSVEDAIALLGVINTVIAYMLNAIKPPPLVLTSPPGNETAALENKAE